MHLRPTGHIHSSATTISSARSHYKPLQVVVDMSDPARLKVLLAVHLRHLDLVVVAHGAPALKKAPEGLVVRAGVTLF